MATFGDLQAAASFRDPDEASDDDDDEEYVPGVGDDGASSCSEESASGDDEEGPAEEAAEEPAARTRKKVAGKKPGRQRRRRGPQAAELAACGSRARRGGIRLEDEVVETQTTASTAAAAPAKQAEAASALQLPDPGEEKSQKRAADLYASFLSDVGARPAAASAAAAAAPAASGSVAKATTAVKPAASSYAAAAAAPATKTKVFDFAGESVTVEVPAAPPSSASAAASSTSAKRPSGVGGGVQNLLERLSKRPKLSTLEKSRLDWETFKSAEGISEDLAAHNRGRGGFLEKRAFLERADYRQFELERDARLSSSRQGQGGSGGRKP